MKTKTCAKCKEEKRVTEFYRDEKAASGYTSYCKTCKGIKNEDRFALPELDPVQWEYHFCIESKCVRCNSAKAVALVIDGTRVPTPTTIAEAKAHARNGEVYCRNCIGVPVSGVKHTLRVRHRQSTLEERIAATDFILESQSKIGDSQFLKRLKKQDKMHPLVHDAVVDTYVKRHADKRTRDELNERYPVLTEAKSRTSSRHESQSYDQLFDYWQNEERKSE